MCGDGKVGRCYSFVISLQLLTFSLEIDPFYGLLQFLLRRFAQGKSVGDARVVGDSMVGSCCSFIISTQLLTLSLLSLEIDPVYAYYNSYCVYLSKESLLEMLELLETAR